MKLCQVVPETVRRIESGALSLTTASQLQSFFEKKEKKDKQQLKESSQKKTPLSQEETSLSSASYPKETIGFCLDEKKELLKKVEGCSTRETQKLLSQKEPELALPQEKIRFLGNGKIELRVVLDEKALQQLEELKALFAHKNPNLSFGSLLSVLSKEGLEKHNPLWKGTSPQSIEKKDSTKTEASNTSLDKKLAPTLAVENPISPELETCTIPVKSPNVQNSMTPSKQRKEPKSCLSRLPSHKKHRSSAPNFERTRLKKESRYIPANLRDFIWKRDQGQCTYKYHKTGRQCSSKHWLQMDHIQPLSYGGKTEAANLRLMCAAHNQARMALEA